MSEYNADCVIMQPHLGRDSTETLQSTHTQRNQDAIRCRFTQLSSKAAASALGEGTMEAYSCRAITRLPVMIGWTIQVKPDGGEWRDYQVRATNRVAGHLHMTVEGI